MGTAMPDAVATVHQAWGDEAPEWVVDLARECNRTSQRKAGQLIGYTCGTVNQVLKNRRKHDGLQAVANAVHKALRVSCPVLGDISRDECLGHQVAPFNNSNHQRIRLYKACRECEHGGCHGK